MDSAPDNPTTATTVMVSLWQRNQAGLKAEKFMAWARARENSVHILTSVAYE